MPDPLTRRQFLGAAGAALAGSLITPVWAAGQETPMRKLEDIVIYRNDDCYSCFPSLATLPGGGLLAAFRRAPNRLHYGHTGNSHVDPNSYLMLVRSTDGRHWTSQPDLICAHPLGGSQDPCLYRLDNGDILCASYLWMLLHPGAQEGSAYIIDDRGHRFAFMGGYFVRSTDDGRTWGAPQYPYVSEDWQGSLPGWRLAPYNRGGMLQLRSGRLLFAVQRGSRAGAGHTEEHLVYSDDRGQHWHYGGVIAADPQVIFDEAQLYETPAGDLVCFMRTAAFDDHTAVARSTDGGRTWGKWQDTGIIGHPHHALRLPDGRVWLVYGYRHQLFGIRGRVLDPECTRFDTPELVLRDDGGGGDIGYPWSTLLPDGKVLTAYYFHLAAEGPEATRFIGGTILQI